jgi:DNA repair protein RAD16
MPSLKVASGKQQSGFKRKGKIIKEQSPLHQIHWSRIVVSIDSILLLLPSTFHSQLGYLQLDEAHNIKERSTNTAKAAFELTSDYKWCLSGTPLQNRVGELYSLVRFLGGDPFSIYFCKSNAIYIPEQDIESLF